MAVTFDITHLTMVGDIPVSTFSMKGLVLRQDVADWLNELVPTDILERFKRGRIFYLSKLPSYDLKRKIQISFVEEDIAMLFKLTWL